MATGKERHLQLLDALNRPSGEQHRTTVPQLEHWRAYLTLQQLTGARVSPQALKSIFQQRDWAGTFVRVATLGALMANRGVFDASVRQLTLGPLLGLRDSARPMTTMIADGVEHFGRDAATAHEHVIYFLEALAVLEGADGGEPISEPELALALLFANDYLTKWLDDDSRPLSDEERLLAELSPLGRFNLHREPMRAIARAALMLSERPVRGTLSDESTWISIQEEAFGSSLRTYVSHYVAPLLVMSRLWGSRINGKLILPTVEPSTWFSETKLPPEAGRAYIDTLSMSRAEAASALRETLDADGLPRSVALFYRKPFVRVSDREVAAATPWALMEQLRGGCWSKYRQAVAARHSSTTWLNTFGDLAETWCRNVAKAAARSRRFKSQLLLSARAGDPDEIEDVTVRDGDRAILFSVKGSFMAEDVARVFRSRTAVLDWYERFFFATVTSDFRGGAVRLLDEKVKKIRAGKTHLPADVWIDPVIVTADDIGEHAVLYRYLDRRCEEETLLDDERVSRITLMSVDRYELLMAYTSRGGSIGAFFAKKNAAKWRQMRAEDLLHHLAGDLLKLTLPELEDAFDTVMETTTVGLFARRMPAKTKRRRK